jgi:hypothetical protein
VLPKRKLEDMPPYERLPSRLLKDTMPRPANSKEARKWLNELADFLSTSPNVPRRFRFIAYGIKKFLRHHEPLQRALGLASPQNTRRGRPAVPDDTVRSIVSMLCKNAKLPNDNRISVSDIAKNAGVSKDTVETIRAELNKVAMTVPDYERDPDSNDVRPTEWKSAEERAQQVPPARRRVIIEGMAESIDWCELVDPPNPSAPTDGNPDTPTPSP